MIWFWDAFGLDAFLKDKIVPQLEVLSNISFVEFNLVSIRLAFTSGGTSFCYVHFLLFAIRPPHTPFGHCISFVV